MTILLRDDFTGSGSLAGRTPDGVSSGAWANDSWQQGGDIATATSISGGLLTTLGGTSSSWGASAPLTGSPIAAYIEANIVCAAYDGGWTVQMGVCHTPSSNTFRGTIGVYQASSTEIQINYPLGPIVSGSDLFTVANVNNVVIRAEVVGSSLKVYADGVFVFESTLTNPPLAGGGIYIDNNGNSNTSIPRFAYVEAGTMAPPVIPPFWTQLRGAREVI